MCQRKRMENGLPNLHEDPHLYIAFYYLPIYDSHIISKSAFTYIHVCIVHTVQNNTQQILL